MRLRNRKSHFVLELEWHIACAHTDTNTHLDLDGARVAGRLVQNARRWAGGSAG